MVRAWRVALAAACRAACRSPFSTLEHRFFDVVSLGKALRHHVLHLTQVLMSTW